MRTHLKDFFEEGEGSAVDIGDGVPTSCNLDQLSDAIEMPKDEVSYLSDAPTIAEKMTLSGRMHTTNTRPNVLVPTLFSRSTGKSDFTKICPLTRRYK